VLSNEDAYSGHDDAKIAQRHSGQGTPPTLRLRGKTKPSWQNPASRTRVMHRTPKRPASVQSNPVVAAVRVPRFIGGSISGFQL
jgi:hypothetical protein